MPLCFGGYAGMIVAHSKPNAPDGWLLCDGKTKEISAYQDLFDAIGTVYNTGGEASGYFRLPFLNGYEYTAGISGPLMIAPGKSVVGASNTYPAGTITGSENHSHSTSSSVTVSNFSDGAHSHGKGIYEVIYTAIATGSNPAEHNISSDTWGASGSNISNAASGNYATARSTHTHSVGNQVTAGGVHNHYHEITGVYPKDSTGGHGHSTNVTGSSANTSGKSLNSYHNVVYIIKT